MKFSSAFLPFAVLAGRAMAQSQQPLGKLPPGCLLHAVNTQDEPSDLNSVCGNNAKDVQEAIASLCQSNVASQAQSAFIATCSGAGKSVAAYTASAQPSKSVAVSTDVEGHVVTKTTSPDSSSTGNAAPIVAQPAGSGYVAVVVAIIAVAAY